MLEQTEHKFNYDWTLKNANFTKDKGKVFSCFACGGGSSMGYKLAGFDVVGCNEIDKRVMDLYERNHHPRYAFLEPIQTFKERTAFPDALYNLDILDGSPPCSTFTIAMARTRQETWGKEKRFREGQAEQVLDTLFFDFIDVVRKLRPKVVIAENVKGLLQGAAKKYVQRIHMEFEDAGYTCQHFLLDAQYMGVPQHRERVFFVCLRNDLIQYVPTAHTLFDTYPVINLNFDAKSRLHETEKPISLLRHLLMLHSNEGDVVFDAYAGSFSTAIACYKEKRKFIGCEILPKYFEKAMKRLEWEQRTQYLF